MTTYPLLFIHTNRFRNSIAFLFVLFFAKAKGQFQDTVYHNVYNELNEMLSNEDRLSFKRAVFITENAFYDNRLSYEDFDRKINKLVSIAKTWIKYNPLSKYRYEDSIEVNKTLAIFRIMKDTITIRLSDGKLSKILPYTYDFEDFFAQKDWSKMFVTKLLSQNSGNCHSLPYLYKILCDELEVKNAWLSFAPYHIYIKNHCEGIGWYNTELTSGQFPTDAWIMASGYVPADAIRSGIYMDTLSDRQAVANCVLDLAKGYERKYKLYKDSFIINCCDLTLKFHPNNINAILYKAETLKKIYLIDQKGNPQTAAAIYPIMEKLYLHALDLGYKEMPEKMYREWLLSVAKQRDKYSNKRVKESM